MFKTTFKEGLTFNSQAYSTVLVQPTIIGGRAGVIGGWEGVHPRIRNYWIRTVLAGFKL
jgi:hypothetical protein